jgi:hypothetical protein
MKRTVMLIEQALGVLSESSAVSIDKAEMTRQIAAWQREYESYVRDRAQERLGRDRTAANLLKRLDDMEAALLQLDYKSAADVRTRDAVLADIKRLRVGQMRYKAVNTMLDRLQRFIEDTHVRDLEGGPSDDTKLEQAVRVQPDFDASLRDWEFDLRHPMHMISDVHNAAESAAESAAAYTADLEAQADQARGLVEAALRRIGVLWEGSGVRIVPTFAWNKRYISETNATISVRVGAHAMTVFLPMEDEDGRRRELEVGDIEEGDREDMTDAFADYQRLISELEEPGSVEREGDRVLTLYTARPSEHRAELERAGKLPGGVFLSDDLEHVEGLASDLRGSRAERDIWIVEIKRRHVLRTLKGRTAYYQIIGTKPVEVESMELFTVAGG